MYFVAKKSNYYIKGVKAKYKLRKKLFYKFFYILKGFVKSG